MKMFVEEKMVLEMRVFLEFLHFSVHGPPPIRIFLEKIDDPLCKRCGHLFQGHRIFVRDFYFKGVLKYDPSFKSVSMRR